MPTRAMRARIERVEVRLAAAASHRERRELGAFVRFCVGRLERELAPSDHWIVTIVPDPAGGYASRVIAERRGEVLQAGGSGRDGTLAAWDALGKVEQALREASSRWAH